MSRRQGWPLSNMIASCDVGWTSPVQNTNDDARPPWSDCQSLVNTVRQQAQSNPTATCGSQKGSAGQGSCQFNVTCSNGPMNCGDMASLTDSMVNDWKSTSTPYLTGGSVQGTDKNKGLTVDINQVICFVSCHRPTAGRHPHAFTCAQCLLANGP